MELEPIILWAKTQLTTNEFFSGGIVLMLGGYVGYIARFVPAFIAKNFRRKFVMEFEIRSTDVAFYWFDTWLAKHAYAKRTRLLRVKSRYPSSDNSEGNHGPRIIFIPGDGWHLLHHKGLWALLHRYDEKGGSLSEEATPILKEERAKLYTLTIWKKKAQEVFTQARDNVFEKNRDTINTYVNRPGFWTGTKQCFKRSLDSVILPKNMASEIEQDLVNFLKHRDDYIKMQVPWHRGYLLEGPPGNGKTTVAISLASKLNRDIYFMCLGDVSNDGTLAERFNDVPSNGILCIEDIDTALPTRAKKINASGITMGGLLACLDGPLSGHGQIVIITSNHPEKLDPALLRPGRIDRRWKITPPDKDQLTRLYKRFFPCNDGGLELWLKTPYKSMAEAQESLLAVWSHNNGLEQKGLAPSLVSVVPSEMDEQTQMHYLEEKKP